MCLLLQTVSGSFQMCQYWGCVLERQLVSSKCDNADHRNLEGLSRRFYAREEIVDLLAHGSAMRRVDAKNKSRRGVSCHEDHLVYDSIRPDSS